MGVRIGDVSLGARPAIVACGGEQEIEALAAAEGAHLVELRADLFDAPTPERVVGAIDRVRAGGRPIILTVRRREEGGAPVPDDLRLAILAAGLPLVDAVDLEIASRETLETLRPALAAGRRALILSAHDFMHTPAASALQATIDAGRALGADVVKVATRTDSVEDLCTLLAVTLANRTPGIVTLGMGPYGPLSRVALPAAGSWMTYASVGRPTAPGQLPLADLVPIVGRLYDGT